MPLRNSCLFPSAGKQHRHRARRHLLPGRRVQEPRGTPAAYSHTAQKTARGHETDSKTLTVKSGELRWLFPITLFFQLLHRLELFGKRKMRGCRGWAENKTKLQGQTPHGAPGVSGHGVPHGTQGRLRARCAVSAVTAAAMRSCAPAGGRWARRAGPTGTPSLSP